MRDFDPDHMRGSLATVIADARRVRSRAEAKRERELGGAVAELPLPDNRAPILCRVHASGDRRQRIVFHIPDVAYIELNVETGTMSIQAKAKALWAHGWTVWCSTFLGLGSWWAGGELHDMGGAAAAGWRVTGVELCCDFIDVPWRIKDVGRFLTPGRSTQGLRNAFKRGGDPDLVDTIEIGKRSSNVSWCLYRKTTQILQAKDGDESTYASTWEAGGWDGEEEVTRVELRLTKRALTLEGSGGDVLELRDPATLGDRHNLALAWVSHTSSYWLPLDDGHTRATNSECDPRWEVVQAAAGVPEVRLEQLRAVQVATWAEAKERTCKQALRSLQRLLAMHGHRAVGPDGYAAAAVTSLLSLRESMPDVDKLLMEYAKKYAQEREPFLGEEIWERGAKLVEGCRGIEPIERPASEGFWWVDDGDD